MAQKFAVFSNTIGEYEIFVKSQTIYHFSQEDSFLKKREGSQTSE
ncbi:hypothetical protein WBS58_26930 [Bacillus albus]